jgi:hypothetical protein
MGHVCIYLIQKIGRLVAAVWTIYDFRFSGIVKLVHDIIFISGVVVTNGIQFLDII